MNLHDDELAALLALDALEPLEQADAELRLGVFPPSLRGVSTALAEAVAQPPPEDLRPVVLGSARTRRSPGDSAEGVVPCTPAVGFALTVTDFADLLDSLDDDEWLRPAHDDHGRVRDLVSHLIGIERLSARWLDPDDDVPPVLDHLGATAGVAAELAELSGHSLARVWHAAALRVAATAAAGDPHRPVRYHDLTTDVAGHLTIRTFELWAHSMDISLATGRPLLRLDDERMLTLSQRFMNVVPVALGYHGPPLPHVTVRFVLTGPSGGCYDVPAVLGDPPGEPAVTVVADTVDLCRLAARRLPPDEVADAIEGDAELAALVLSRLGALARD